MSWQLIVLIAIGAVVVLCVGGGLLIWALWNKAQKQMERMVSEFGEPSKPRESVEEMVDRLTGPSNPFDILKNNRK
jgi:hypothetical protein